MEHPFRQKIVVTWRRKRLEAKDGYYWIDGRPATSAQFEAAQEAQRIVERHLATGYQKIERSCKLLPQLSRTVLRS